MSLSRRRFIAGTAAVAATSVAAPYVHAQKRGGTLRFVPHADLKILDPIWTTAYITRNHGYMIFDTLFALDGNLKLQPQMVDKYTVSKDAMKYSFTLRDGLKFHDGAAVTAEDCVASIKRWGAKDAVGRLMMASLSKMAPVDKKTFAIELETPFGLVLDALGKPSASPSFIMPARLAATDPNEQVKEVSVRAPSSSPRTSGSRATAWSTCATPTTCRARRTPAGRPAASGRWWTASSGATSPTPPPPAPPWRPARSTTGRTSARLRAAAGEERQPQRLRHRPQGQPGYPAAEPPAPALQQQEGPAGAAAPVDQKNYLQAVIGHEKYYKTCPSVFMCGGLPYETSAGSPKPDLERARALFKESGYDGRPIVVLDPADSPYAHAPALVTMEVLKSLGANVDLQSMDWSTMVARRAKKEAPAQGGWNVFHTWSTSFDTMTPAVSSVLGGAGEKAWFGWPTSEPMEKLRADFAREPNEAKRKAIAEKVQLLAYDEVPYVPWGQFVVPGAFRKNVQGVLQFGATLLWNIQV